MKTGSTTMSLSELVAGAIVAAPMEMKLIDLAQLMEGEGVGSIAILDDHDDFVGIVTDRDIVVQLQGIRTVGRPRARS